MNEKYWQDFQEGDRQKTLAITMTEAHIVAWAGLTMDFYPLHMDEEYCRNSTFGARVVHGPMIFAMAIGMVGSTGFLGGQIIAWLGVEKMRISKPVKIGDTIATIARVIEQRATRNETRGIVVFEYEVLNQHGETVLTFHNLLMLPRRA